MIGVYDYTVILTYISLMSAATGIAISTYGQGHPYIGTLFLLICGLCDAFDGKVARIKKNRTDMEKKFGIQIDSLSDVIAFGVLPVCIGGAIIKKSTLINSIENPVISVALKVVLFGTLAFYMLCAMIRLAYYNVTEEERQNAEGGVRRYYTGLPVTMAIVVFPSILLIAQIVEEIVHKVSTFELDISILYFLAALVTGFFFISKIKIPKPKLKGILIIVGIVTFEFVLLVLLKFVIGE